MAHGAREVAHALVWLSVMVRRRTGGNVAVFAGESVADSYEKLPTAIDRIASWIYFQILGASCTSLRLAVTAVGAAFGSTTTTDPRANAIPHRSDLVAVVRAKRRDKTREARPSDASTADGIFCQHRSPDRADAAKT